MTTIKAECVDKMILWKFKEERTAADIAPDVAKKKCLGSDNPQENHQTPQECQGRSMTNVRVQCADEMGLLKCKKQTTADSSSVMRTPERPPCPKKTQRMRKPIKSEILRFGKVETRVEAEEEERCPRGDLYCKEEKFLLHFRTDGYSKKNIPERWLQDSTEDSCIVPQEDQALNLTSYEKNILQSKVEKSTYRPDGFNSRGRTDSDCSEDYSTMPDYQADCLGVGTDEATSQIDSEEEMFLAANRSIKEEDANEGKRTHGNGPSVEETEYPSAIAPEMFYCLRALRSGMSYSSIPGKQEEQDINEKNTGYDLGFQWGLLLLDVYMDTCIYE
ncbi:hypothetical protein GDO78_019141 [Eleutherodactylus coqui]|uniref:Uncharacterized protein n=1 Tax=Eleutherodactylus coqui TaxID=57060 RepID=A0A8J6BD14_ELECQ|nr:hypothetical protein GDO78_019141 [Eleutherodactylus coqui]